MLYGIVDKQSRFRLDACIRQYVFEYLRVGFAKSHLVREIQLLEKWLE
jgi:hypothetical protein